MRTPGWVVVGALVAVVALAACASTTVAPVTVPAQNDSVGRFVWHDLVTHDTAASQKFYAALLGWEFEPITRNGRPYLIVRSGGEVAGGIVQREETKAGPAAWLSYLSVASLDQAIGQVTSAGGKVVLAPTTVGAYGRVAVVRDPQGAPLGLASVTQTLPAEAAQPPLKEARQPKRCAEKDQSIHMFRIPA